MSQKKTITFVSRANPNKEFACECARQLEIDLDISMCYAESVCSLFPLLSDSSYHTDFIAIDLEQLISGREGVDIFDIINTLSTLIKCTVYRIGEGKPRRRTTKICLLIAETTPANIVRQAMLIPETHLGMLMGENWTYEQVKDNVAANLAGDCSTPKQILDIVKPKRGNIVKRDAIDLTPREQQILKLIQNRGASNKVIAKILDISESTVKLHIGNVLKKYGCKNRTQLAVFSRSAEV